MTDFLVDLPNPADSRLTPGPDPDHSLIKEFVAPWRAGSWQKDSLWGGERRRGSCTLHPPNKASWPDHVTPDNSTSFTTWSEGDIGKWSFSSRAKFIKNRTGQR